MTRRAAGLTLAIAVSFVGMFGGAKSAAAFCIPSGTHPKWDSGYQTLLVRPGVPSSWNGAIMSSVFAWNGVRSTLNYFNPQFNTTAAGDFELRIVDFSDQGLGSDPGRTFNSTKYSPHARSTIYLNSDYTWYTNGTMNYALKKADVQTVVTHEVGHASGLEHPDFCHEPPSPAEKSAVMTVTWTKKWTIGSDDRDGIRALYP
jgi:hypothetical protein